jgi:hypothetical protein
MRTDRSRPWRRAAGAAFAGTVAAATALWAVPAGSEEPLPHGAGTDVEAEVEAEAHIGGEGHAEGEVGAEGEAHGGEEATVEPLPLVPLTDGDAADEATISVRQDCDDSVVIIESSKDISNVVLRYDDGDVKVDSGFSGTSAVLPVDAQRALVAVFVKAGANASGEGPGYGEMFPVQACASVSPDLDVETPAGPHQPIPSEAEGRAGGAGEAAAEGRAHGAGGAGAGEAEGRAHGAGAGEAEGRAHGAGGAGEAAAEGRAHGAGGAGEAAAEGRAHGAGGAGEAAAEGRAHGAGGTGAGEAEGRAHGAGGAGEAETEGRAHGAGGAGAGELEAGVEVSGAAGAAGGAGAGELEAGVEVSGAAGGAGAGELEAGVEVSGAAGGAGAGELEAGVEASGGAGGAGAPGEVEAGARPGGEAPLTADSEASVGVEAFDRSTASARAPLAGDHAAAASRTQLPVTGASSWVLGALGFALTALGIGAVWATDRSRRPQPRHLKR